MKARETALRAKRFELDENDKKIANLELMIADFKAMAADLDRQIAAEEERTGIRDPNHFAYSTFAKSAAHRRNNLQASTGELLAKLELAMKTKNEAQNEVADASSSLSKSRNRVRRRPDRALTATSRA